MSDSNIMAQAMERLKSASENKRLLVGAGGTPQNGVSSNSSNKYDGAYAYSKDKSFGENAGNALVRTYATMYSLTKNVEYGALKAVEGVGDFLISSFGFIGSLFGASDQWAKDAVSFDVSKWLMDKGDYMQPIALAAKLTTDTEDITEASWINDAPEEVSGFIHDTEQALGGVVPSVLLATLTGGASVGVSLAQQGAIVGVSQGLSTAGSSTEGALNQGADLGNALGYGTIKGTISGVSTGLTMGMGLSALNNTDNLIADKVFQKTGSVIGSKIAGIAVNAGIDGVEEFTDTLIDPVIKQITFDNEAISKAYGDDEAVKETLGNAGKAFATSFLVSGLIQGVREGTDYVKLGKDGYRDNFIMQNEISSNPEITNEQRKLQNAMNDYSKLQEKAKNNKIDYETFKKKAKILTDKMNTLSADLDTKIDTLSKKSIDIKHGNKEIGDLQKNARKEYIKNVKSVTGEAISLQKAHYELVNKLDNELQFKPENGEEITSLRLNTNEDSIIVKNDADFIVAETLVKNVETTELPKYVDLPYNGFKADTNVIKSLTMGNSQIKALNIVDIRNLCKKAEIQAKAGKPKFEFNTFSGDGVLKHKYRVEIEGNVIKNIEAVSPEAPIKSTVKVSTTTELNRTVKKHFKDLGASDFIVEKKTRYRLDAESYTNTKLAAQDIASSILNGKIVYEENGKQVESKLSKVLRKGEYGRIKQELADSLDVAMNEKDLTKRSAMIDDCMSKAVKEITTETSNYKRSVKATHNLDKKINQFQEFRRETVAFNSSDDVLNHSLAINDKLLNSFASKNGYTTRGYKTLTDFSNYYELTNIDKTALGFNPVIKQALNDLKESIEVDYNAKQYRQLNAFELEKLDAIATAMKHDQQDYVNRYKKQEEPKAYALAKSVNERTPSNNNILVKAKDAVTEFARTVSTPAYSMESLEGYKGIFYKKTFTDTLECIENKKRFQHKWGDNIRDKISEYQITRKQLNSNIKVQDTDVPSYVLRDYYCHYLTGEGTKTYDNALNGVNYKDKKGKSHFIKLSMEEIESALPDNQKMLCEHLVKNVYNGEESLTNEYNKFMVDKYGASNNVEGLYYPTSKTKGEKTISSTAGEFNGVPTNQHTKTRTKNSYIFEASDPLNRLTEYLDSCGNDMYLRQHISDIDRMLNTKVGDANDSKETLIGLISKNDPKWESHYTSYIQRAMGVKRKQTRNQKLLNNTFGHFASATLGANVGTVIKQYPSIYFTGKIDAKTFFKHSTQAAFQSFKGMKGDVEMLNKALNDFPTLRERWQKDTLAVAGNTTLEHVSKFNELTLKGMSLADQHTVYKEIALLSYQGEDLGYGKYGTDENYNNYVKPKMLELLSTQVNSNEYLKNEIQSGDKGQVAKYLFGNFAGATRGVATVCGQEILETNTFSKVKSADLDTGLKSATEKVDNITKNIDSTNKDISTLQAKVDVETDEHAKKTLKAKIKENKANLDILEQGLLKAQGNQAYYDSKLKAYNEWKAHGGKSRIATMCGSLVGMGLITALANKLNRKLKGQEEWGDNDISKTLLDILYSSSVEWIPVIGNIANVLKGNDMSMPIVDVFNTLGGTIKAIGDFAVNQDEASESKLLRGIIESASFATGTPLKNIYSLVMGSLTNFGVDGAIKTNNLLYNVSASNQVQNINTALKYGNEVKAKSTMSAVLETEKAGKVSEKLLDEMFGLYKQGYTNVLPKNINDKVNKNIYSKANYIANNLVKKYAYKALESDEEKAKAIKYVYDCYYDSESKGGKIIANTTIDLSNYVPYVIKAKSIKVSEGEKKTRKELTLESLNGLSRDEKLLVLYLCGYSLSDEDTKKLSNYFAVKGDKKRLL